MKKLRFTNSVYVLQPVFILVQKRKASYVIYVHKCTCKC